LNEKNPTCLFTYKMPFYKAVNKFYTKKTYHMWQNSFAVCWNPVRFWLNKY